jgi:hypothetical protein
MNKLLFPQARQILEHADPLLACAAFSRAIALPSATRIAASGRNACRAKVKTGLGLIWNQDRHGHK